METAPAAIPNRPLFKPAEVCEIAGVQPFVLRSWEAEFPNLGYAKDAGSPRVYRRADVERVLQIKQLVFGEGLTIAGARRRLEGEKPPVDRDAPSMTELYGRQTRDRLLHVKRGLEAVLALLVRDARATADAGQRKGSTTRRKASARPARAARPPARAKKTAKRKRAGR